MKFRRGFLRNEYRDLFIVPPQSEAGRVVLMVTDFPIISLTVKGRNTKALNKTLEDDLGERFSSEVG